MTIWIAWQPSEKQGSPFKDSSRCTRMFMAKWASSHEEALVDIPMYQRVQTVDIAYMTTQSTAVKPVIKTLGVIYSAKEDSFTFAVPEIPPTTWTLATILGTYSRIFDPHGYNLPYLVLGRLNFQDLWQRSDSKNWEEPIPHNQLRKWREWVHHLQHLPKVKVKR